MAVAVAGLSSPEALVAWKPLTSYDTVSAGGLRLYWSDVRRARLEASAPLQPPAKAALSCPPPRREGVLARRVQLRPSVGVKAGATCYAYAMHHTRAMHTP